MARSKTEPPLTLRAFALGSSPMGRVLRRVAVVAALLLLSGVVMRQARAQAWRLPECTLTGRSITFEGLPVWADARILAALRQSEHLRLSVSVFDPQAEERIRALLARHPLVRKVEHVRIVYPSRAHVRVALREPACFVQTPGRRPDGRHYLMLLSADARRLDERVYAGYLSMRPPLAVLTGVERTAPPVPGVPWDNLKEQVAEGLEAARVADRLWRDLGWGRKRHVARIDVSRFPSRLRGGGEVLLVLNDGTAVEWGRTERDLAGALEEDGYERKRSRLALALDGSPARLIDVRFPADPVLPR
jgi:hypothetical protein